MTATLRLHFLHVLKRSPDPTLYGSHVTLASQLQLGYGIVSNVIPCLKPFVAAYEGVAQQLSYQGHVCYNANNNTTNTTSALTADGPRQGCDSHTYALFEFPRSRTETAPPRDVQQRISRHTNAEL